MATWLTADPKTLWPHLDDTRLEEVKRLIERHPATPAQC